MKTIQLIILPDGQLKLETRGFNGPECRKASRFLEEALGRRTAEQLTAEFYKGQVQQHDRLQQEEGS